MKRLTYTALIIVFALIVGFLLLLIAGGYIFEGEAAIGVGFLWYYSLPGVLILGYLIARVSFSWYVNQNAVLMQTVGLLGSAIIVAVLAPAITHFVFWGLSLW